MVGCGDIFSAHGEKSHRDYHVGNTQFIVGIFNAINWVIIFANRQTPNNDNLRHYVDLKLRPSK